MGCGNDSPNDNRMVYSTGDCGYLIDMFSNCGWSGWTDYCWNSVKPFPLPLCCINYLDRMWNYCNVSTYFGNVNLFKFCCHIQYALRTIKNIKYRSFIHHKYTIHWTFAGSTESGCSAVRRDPSPTEIKGIRSMESGTKEELI